MKDIVRTKEITEGLDLKRNTIHTWIYGGLIQYDREELAAGRSAIYSFRQVCAINFCRIFLEHAPRKKYLKPAVEAFDKFLEHVFDYSHDYSWFKDNVGPDAAIYVQTAEGEVLAAGDTYGVSEWKAAAETGGDYPIVEHENYAGGGDKDFLQKLFSRGGTFTIVPVWPVIDQVYRIFET